MPTGKSEAAQGCSRKILSLASLLVGAYLLGGWPAVFLAFGVAGIYAEGTWNA